MKRAVLIFLSIVAIGFLIWGVDRAIGAGCNPAALGGTGTCTVPSAGQVPIGNGSGSYTPATLTPGANIVITNASGSVTIGVTGTATGTVYLLQAGHGISLSPASITSSGTIAVNTSTVIADVVASGQFLPSSTTYVATVNGQSGAVTIGIPATTTVNGTQATVFHIIGDGTTVTSTVNGATTTFSIITSGNWQGTWQGASSSTFYKASNPSGYISGNQTITFVAAGDATGTATGTTMISDTMTVTGLQGKALPALATGTLKYSGGAWTFDGNTYLTSGINVTTTGPLGGGGPLTSAGLTLTCTTCLTGNQTITLTGAVTGSGTTSIATSYATSTLYSLFSGSGPVTFNTSTGAIGWTNSLNYITGVTVNGQSGTSFSIVAGPGISSTVSGATTTLSLNLGAGCTGGNFVQTISATGTITCAIPSGSFATTTVNHTAALAFVLQGDGSTITSTTSGATTTYSVIPGLYLTPASGTALFYPLTGNPSGFTTTTVQAALNALSVSGCATYATSTGAITVTCLSTSTAAATYLNLSGSNANQNINIGSNALSAASTTVGNLYVSTTSILGPQGNIGTFSNATSFQGNPITAILWAPTANMPTSTAFGTSTPALILARQGLATVAYSNYAFFNISRYATGTTNANTELTIALAGGSTDAGFVPTNILSLQAGGNVGVGTTNPSSTLDVFSNNSSVQLGNIASTFGAIGFGTTLANTNYSIAGEGANTYINRASGGAIRFRENNGNNDQLTILGGGNVGVNQSTPVNPFDASTTAADFRGNLAVGTTTTTTATLTVNGTSWINGTSTFSHANASGSWNYSLTNDGNYLEVNTNGNIPGTPQVPYNIILQNCPPVATTSTAVTSSSWECALSQAENFPDGSRSFVDWDTEYYPTGTSPNIASGWFDNKRGTSSILFPFDLSWNDGSVNHVGFSMTPASNTSASNFNTLDNNGTGYFTVGTASSTTGAFDVYQNGSNTCAGIYDSGATTIYGLTDSLPAPAGCTALGGYYKGLAIGGSASGTGTPIFGVLNSSQSSNGKGHTALTVYDTNEVDTFNNTLDDGNGNATVSSTLKVGSTLTVSSSVETAASFAASTPTTTVIEGSASSSVCQKTYGGAVALYTTYLSSGQVLTSTNSCQ